VVKGRERAATVTGYSATASVRSTSAYRSHTVAGCAHRVRRKLTAGDATSTVTAAPNDAPDRFTASAHTNGPSSDVPAKTAEANSACLVKMAAVNTACSENSVKRNSAYPAKMADSKSA
jgi:hypothetical protein